MTTATELEIKTLLKLPNMYSVVFLNDDFTPMDFVVDVLMVTFSYSLDDATYKAQEIHNSGESIVGTYVKEIAEQKKIEVDALAKKFKHPLRVKLQENV